jgi:hypothetical protein
LIYPRLARLLAEQATTFQRAINAASAQGVATPRTLDVPVTPGQPVTAHWGLPDPAEVEGSDLDKKRAFTDTYKMLSHRIGIFVHLPIDSLSSIGLEGKVREIGKSAPGNGEARHSA